VKLCFKDTPEQRTPTLHLERILNKEGRETFNVHGEPLSLKDYQARLVDFHLMDALKTIIRQEQITDLFQLDPGDRFLRVKELLNDSPADSFDQGNKAVTPLAEF
jgi:chromosome segregation ATPase